MKNKLLIIIFLVVGKSGWAQNIEFIKIEHTGIQPPPMYNMIIATSNVNAYYVPDNFVQYFATDKKTVSEIKTFIKTYKYPNGPAYIEFGTFEMSIDSVIDTKDKPGKPFYLKSIFESMDFFHQLTTDLVLKECDPKIINYLTGNVLAELEYKSPPALIAQTHDSIANKINALPYNWYTMTLAPRFTWGNLFYYVNEHIKYPAGLKNSTTSLLIASILIDTTGKLTGARILKNVSPEIDWEIISALNSSPKWSPAVEYERSGLKRINRNVVLAFLITTDPNKKTITVTKADYFVKDDFFEGNSVSRH